MIVRFFSTTLFTLLLGVAATTIALPSRAEAQLEVRRHPIHLLAGVGGEGGGFVDQSTGLMGGGQVHFGVHIHGFEMYGLTQGFVGSLLGSSRSNTVTGLMWNSAMFGFGVGVFHLAAGPSLDFAWGCVDTGSETGCYNGAPLWGVDARMALQFGNFEVSANVHPTFYGRSTVTGITLGLGWAY